MSQEKKILTQHYSPRTRYHRQEKKMDHLFGRENLHHKLNEEEEEGEKTVAALEEAPTVAADLLLGAGEGEGNKPVNFPNWRKGGRIVAQLPLRMRVLQEKRERK